MTFRDQLVELGACDDSLEWVKDKTIEEAWETCQDSEWIIWVLNQTDLDLIDPLCDMAERVLHLVPEDKRLVCSNAISAARRRANPDELAAAFDASCDVVRDVSGCRTSYWAAAAAACNPAAATYAVAYRAACAVGCAAASASASAATANVAFYDDVADAYSAAFAAAENEEKKKQCDILRKYFTIDQVLEAFSKLVAYYTNRFCPYTD